MEQMSLPNSLPNLSINKEHLKKNVIDKVSKTPQSLQRVSEQRGSGVLCPVHALHRAKPGGPFCTMLYSRPQGRLSIQVQLLNAASLEVSPPLEQAKLDLGFKMGKTNGVHVVSAEMLRKDILLATPGGAPNTYFL